ncbi:MAG TPA: hypothetical protein VKP14_10550, partial [Gaiellaceae bacterium]|nr:hypothetical protein [Gaiellaceae bacterium]
MRARFAAACLVALIAASAAYAGKPGPVKPAKLPTIAWGVADDASKYSDDGGAWFDGLLKGANLTENRWTLSWDATNPTAIDELPFLVRAAPQAQAAGIH